MSSNPAAGLDRTRVDDKDRAQIPVPVLFTAHGWDPTTCSVQDWLAAQLAVDYPLLQHRGGPAEAAALVADGAVAMHLHDVTGPQAADYLQRARTGPAPAGWTQLLTHLREDPDSVLTRALSTH